MLFRSGQQSAVGRTLVMGGDTYAVVGELEKRRGGFFGENRQDNVLTIPERWARARFGPPERVVLVCFDAPTHEAYRAALAAAGWQPGAAPLG